jgi:hypothetical protein
MQCVVMRRFNKMYPPMVCFPLVLVEFEIDKLEPLLARISLVEVLLRHFAGDGSENPNRRGMITRDWLGIIWIDGHIKDRTSAGLNFEI